MKIHSKMRSKKFHIRLIQWKPCKLSLSGSEQKIYSPSKPNKPNQTESIHSMKWQDLLTSQWHVLLKKPCAFQDLKDTSLLSCRNLKRLKVLIKCYQTTKRKSIKKTNRFSHLTGTVTWSKNLCCHILTGIPPSEPSLLNQRQLCSLSQYYSALLQTYSPLTAQLFPCL